jgi:hypothetical protein
MKWNKPYKKIERQCVVPVNNENIGIYERFTAGVVVDNIKRRGELQLKPIRTVNIDFHKGASTVAIFRITKRHHNTLIPPYDRLYDQAL